MNTAVNLSARSANTIKVDKKSLIEYLGNRITVELDDHSTLTGRLVSLSPTGNLILVDVERERRVKRRRNDDGTRKLVSECYDSVLFIRNSSIVAVKYHTSIINDKSIVDRVGSKQGQVARSVHLANVNPAMPSNSSNIK